MAFSRRHRPAGDGPEEGQEDGLRVEQLFYEGRVQEIKSERGRFWEDDVAAS